MMSSKKFISAILALLIAVCAVPLFAGGCRPDMSRDDFLTTEGEFVKNAKGEKVILRGVNAGGLFVTEHWMSGFKDNCTDSNDYRSLTKKFIERFGEDKTKKLWKEYQANWWSDVDFENCKNMGFNVIRLPFTYMNVDFDAVVSYDKAGKNYDFSDIENFVSRAADHGLYTILDLHGAYGSQNGKDHSGQIINNVSDITFYSDDKYVELTVNLWKALSEKFKNNPAVAAYDILNEPGENACSTTDRHWNFYDKVYSAIRSTGDEHILIMEGLWTGRDLPHPSRYVWENCMYSFHHYAGNIADSSYFSSWNDMVSEVFAQKFGVPLYMGEFTAYSSESKWEYSLDLLNRHNWHWTSWTYKIWNKKGWTSWGIYNVNGTKDDLVDATNDGYDDILKKFSLMKTDDAEKFKFSSGTSLEDVCKKYASATYEYDKPQAGTFELLTDSGCLAVNENNTVIITKDFNNARKFTLVYENSIDGNAYFKTYGGTLTEVGGGLKVTGSTEKQSLFCPVPTEYGFALFSYSGQGYVCADENGNIKTNGKTVDKALIFTQSSFTATE